MDNARKNMVKPSTWLVTTLILFGISFAVHAVALFSGHVLDNIDLRTHYQWAFQFSTVLSEGTFYPRWMPLANDGLGEPSFVIIHPIYYYVVALFKSFGIELWAAMRLTAVASTFMVGVITFGLFSGKLSYRYAMGAAILLQTLPFAAFLFGFHAALPWHFSLPLAVLVIGLSTIRHQRQVDLLLSVSVALLCMTHLLVAFMVLLSVSAMQGLYALCFPRAEMRATLRPWVASIALGLGLSAVYWLLAATSTPLFTVANRVDTHYLDWHNSFVFPFITSGIFGTRWAAVQWILPIAPLSFLIIVGWFLVSQRNSKTEIWWMVSKLWTVGVFALLMSSELAYPLYDSISFLRNIQWPYRFLTVSSIASALAFAAVFGAIFRDSGNTLIKSGLALGAFVSFALFLSLQYKQYHEGAPLPSGQKIMTGHIGQRGAEPASMGPDWQLYIKNGGMAAYCTKENLVCKSELAKSHHHIWTVQADTPKELLLPLFAFPAWKVSIDRMVAHTEIDSPTGLIKLQIPSGEHSVSVDWSLLWQEKIGLLFSGLSLVIAVMVFLMRRYQRRSSL